MLATYEIPRDAGTTCRTCAVTRARSPLKRPRYSCRTSLRRGQIETPRDSGSAWECRGAKTVRWPVGNRVAQDRQRRIQNLRLAPWTQQLLLTLPFPRSGRNLSAGRKNTRMGAHTRVPAKKPGAWSDAAPEGPSTQAVGKNLT